MTRGGDRGRGKRIYVYDSLGHDRIVVAFPSIDRFFPSGCAETPLASGFKTDAAQIIAARGREIEELACEEACVLCCAWAGIREHFSQNFKEKGGGGLLNEERGKKAKRGLD